MAEIASGLMEPSVIFRATWLLPNSALPAEDMKLVPVCSHRRPPFVTRKRRGCRLTKVKQYHGAYWPTQALEYLPSCCHTNRCSCLLHIQDICIFKENKDAHTALPVAQEDAQIQKYF